MKVAVTHNAVECYRRRVDPGCPSEGHAINAILSAFERAGKMRGRTLAGDERWKSDDPPMFIVVKRNSDDSDLVVVTVLGPGDAPEAFPEAAAEEHEREEGFEVESLVTVQVKFRHLRGDREAAAREVAKRVTNAAAGANGCVTGLARIIKVGYPTP